MAARTAAPSLVSTLVSTLAARQYAAWCLSAILAGSHPYPAVGQDAPASALSASAPPASALSLAPAVSLAGSPTASAQPGQLGQADLSPHEGEIRVEGKVLAVDAARGLLTLSVTAFTLPSGNASRLNPPRPKEIQLSDLTLLSAQGDTAPSVTGPVTGAVTGPVTLGLLKDEAFKTRVLKGDVLASAVGADMGSGQALPARRLALWSRAPGGASSSAPVAVGGFSSNAAPENERNERNELADGGFENQDRGLASGWTFGRRARREQDQGGNHFALLGVNADVAEDERKVKTLLEVDPAWKTVRVWARLRLRGSAPGKAQDAHLGVVYYGAERKFLGLGPALTLTQDSEWATLSGAGDVPPGTRQLAIDAGVYGPAGELSVDDVRVVADPPLASGPLRPGFPEGTFEAVDAHGQPRGWNIADSRLARVLEEKGSRFLRLTNSDPAQMLAVDASFPLPPGARQIVLRYRARAQGLALGGQEPFQNARVGYLFTDARGQKVGDWPPTPGLKEDSDWTWIEIKAAVPPEAVLLKISPVLHNASGTLDVDDIQLDVH